MHRKVEVSEEDIKQITDLYQNYGWTYCHLKIKFKISESTLWEYFNLNQIKRHVKKLGYTPLEIRNTEEYSNIIKIRYPKYSDYLKQNKNIITSGEKNNTK